MSDQTQKPQPQRKKKKSQNKQPQQPQPRRRTRQEVIEFKKQLAEQPNTQIVTVNSSETYRTLEMVSQIDKAINQIKNNMLLGYDFEKVTGLFGYYNEFLTELNEFAGNICKEAGIEYRTPKGFKPSQIEARSKNFVMEEDDVTETTKSA